MYVCMCMYACISLSFVVVVVVVVAVAVGNTVGMPVVEENGGLSLGPEFGWRKQESSQKSKSPLPPLIDCNSHEDYQRVRRASSLLVRWVGGSKASKEEHHKHTHTHTPSTGRAATPTTFFLGLAPGATY